MFLHLLTDRQQQIFSRAALAVIRADEVLHARELELCEALAREMGRQDFPSIESDEDLIASELEEIAEPVAARIFLLELAGIAVVDGELDPREHELLERLATALKNQPAVVELMLDFAVRAHRMSDEARMLVFERDLDAAL